MLSKQELLVQLEERILTQAWPSGHRLPGERELARQYGISRTMVREVLRVLEEKGLVETRPGQGTFVHQPDIRIASDTIQILLTVERCSTEDLLEARHILEERIVELAAQRRTESDLAALRSCLDIMEQAAWPTFIDQDIAFHQLLARSSGNPALEIILRPLLDILQPAWLKRMGPVESVAQRILVHHRAIWDAVRMGDPTAARAAMHAHLVQVREDRRFFESQ